MKMTDTEKEQLKKLAEKCLPCPFCGHPKVKIVTEDDLHLNAIYCYNCPAGVSDSRRTIDDLIYFWNRRFKR